MCTHFSCPKWIDDASASYGAAIGVLAVYTNLHGERFQASKIGTLLYFSHECDCMWVGRPHSSPGISNEYGLPSKGVQNWFTLRIANTDSILAQMAFICIQNIISSVRRAAWTALLAHVCLFIRNFVPVFRMRCKKMRSRIEHQGRKREKTSIDCSQNYGNICCAQSCFISHIQNYEWWANQIAERLLLLLLILL